MGLLQRKCEYCHKKSTAPCESLSQAEKCTRYKFINPKNIRNMRDLIGGILLGVLFVTLLILSGCSVQKGCPAKITNNVNSDQKEVLFGSLTPEQIQSIRDYYAKNPNTTDTVIVQPWMGSELIKN